MSIRVEGLRYAYMAGTPFESPALRGVDLDAETGDFVALIGATGSGKSTLIQHLNGLIRPSVGRVFVDGVDVGAATDLKALRRRVGLVFQYPESQLFEETVYADVAFGPRNMGLPEHEIEERVEEALHMVGLDSALVGARSPFALSGGQRRRVAIAGVLAMRPSVLILDEPTAGLDPRGRREILDGIQQVWRQQGLTVVLVTHLMEEAARLATRIWVMDAGRAVLNGTPRDVYAQFHMLRSISLRAPVMTELMHLLRERGKDVRTNVLNIEEAEAEIRRLGSDL